MKPEAHHNTCTRVLNPMSRLLGEPIQATDPGRTVPMRAGLSSLWYRLTNWETWDWRVKYLFIGPAWLWYCVRAKSFWFFTASNPTLTFGGFDGESKREMYEQLPPGTYPKSIFISPLVPLDEVRKTIGSYGFTYPFAVKPDRGKMGLMFRKVTSWDDLECYHKKIHCDYIIQEWADYPLEVSVFYCRLPRATKGHITGFVRKDFLEVTGDGESTLWELIAKYPRVLFRLREMKRKHAGKLHRVLAPGEKYCLSHALNLSRGGKLVSLEHEKDESLLRVFDEFSLYSGKFYYGRYDIKCASIDELKKGKNFLILEFNGSGAEPHHVYGNGYSLLAACSVLVAHWGRLYDISAENHRAGIPYWKFSEGWKFLNKAGRHQRRLHDLDIDHTPG